MNLLTYFKAEHGRQMKLAKNLRISQPLLSQWAYGVRPVPIARCRAIEVHTNGLVTRQDLRPDDWYEHWPELSRFNPEVGARGKVSVRRKGYGMNAFRSIGRFWNVGDGYAYSDVEREREIQLLGRLICAPGSSRLLRQICFAQQRELIRSRSATQVRRMERILDGRISDT